MPLDELRDEGEPEPAAGGRAAPSFVDQPRRNASGTCPGASPGPLSATRTSRSGPDSRTVTATRRGGGAPSAASSALSTRLPTRVMRSRDAMPTGGSAVSSVTTSSIPRSEASAALPSSRAASTGSSTASSSRSVRAWLACSSATPSSTASSGRPSSTSVMTVCSRLADSCACARSASARLRTVSSSPVTAISSVVSRSVVTVPSGWPSRAATAWDTSSTRSRARCTSPEAVRPERNSSASPDGSPSSSTGRPSAPPGRPSSRAASSLASCSRPAGSTTSSPSLTACRTASWASYIRVISPGSRPRVCRRSRRLTGTAPRAASPSASSATAAVPGSWRRSSSPTRSRVMPTATSATTRPPSRTGATARTDGPRVPV